MKRKKILLLMVLLIVSVLFLSSYINFRMIKIDNIYHNEFRDNLATTVQQESSFYLNDLTPFHWDKAIIIQPYTSKTEMQNILGQQWTNRNTYPGYLMEKTFLGKYPLDDDIFHKLIFVKDEKIVLDITIPRGTADFTQIKEIIYSDDDFLAIINKDHSNPIIYKCN